MEKLIYTGKLYSPRINVPFTKKLNERKMKATLYTSGDLAGISSKNFKAYYGWECTDDTGEWCFEAKFDDQVIKIPYSKLGMGSHKQYECMACLLKGIAWVMQKYKLTL